MLLRRSPIPSMATVGTVIDGGTTVEGGRTRVGGGFNGGDDVEEDGTARNTVVRRFTCQNKTED